MKHIDDHRAEVCRTISRKLAELPKEETKCYIYRVHDHLRNLNPRAYEPQILAIGPYHHGTPNTELMEKLKLLYLNSFLQRKNETVDRYVEAIGKIKQKARCCYVDSINFTVAEFTEMLLVDGCFIIELLLKFDEDGGNLTEGDPIFETLWMGKSMQRDLMLFENQIPFFVLCELFKLVNQDSNYLINLIWKFFKGTLPGAKCRWFINTTSDHDIKHLLHLIHIFWSPDLLNKSHQTPADDDQTPRRRRFAATKLRDANVKFEKNDGRDSLFNVTFINGTLKMSHLQIEDGTEDLFRNLIAYEQYFPKKEQPNFVTDYVTFLDNLIDSPVDVEILCQPEILENWLGSDKVVSNIFNKLTDSVTIRDDFIYARVCDAMKKHCKKRRNNWMAMLRRNHFSNPLAILSLTAAVVLLLLTAVQTVCSVLKL